MNAERIDSTPARWRLARDLFARALDRPAESRLAFLKDACGEDLALYQGVAQLLAGSEATGPIEHLESVLRPAPAVLPVAGERIRHYTLVREIGRGGMGVVFQALDERLDRAAALKFLALSRNDDPDARARFLQEARASSALDHPNICTIYEIGESEAGLVYIAMSYYEGRTLRYRLREGPCPLDEAVTIAREVADGLACAHGAGIIHRDIKPENIFLTDSGGVRILDFGIAKLLREQELTEAGARVGTPAYMSPEQLRGEPVDARTDLWSLGVVLFEMTAGRRPFFDPHDAAVMYAILERDPLADGEPPVPEPLRPILARALAKSPRDRYSNVADLARDLANLAAGVPVATASTLPEPLTSFIGRQAELAQLLALVATERMVTLTGPGGAGKTRLALEAGRRLASRFVDGTVFVSLAPVRDPDRVASTLAQALGAPASASRTPYETLSAAIAGRSMLLILDNFEQVVDAAPLVRFLLGACPRLHVMTTSRIVLRIAGEHEFPVPPLAIPDTPPPVSPEAALAFPAIDLFVRRTRAIRPDFALTDSNVAAVAGICARLDGLPLAIELAAARTRLFTPAALLDRLRDRLDLLKTTHRDGPERHQTLRHAIAWSYDLLQPAEQAFFRRLGLFMGDFSLEAAQRLLDGAGHEPADVLDLIEKLVDHSLLQRRDSNDEPRFLMLETLGSFAREALREAGDWPAGRHAHATYFLEVAERAEDELTRRDQSRWLRALEREYDNYRAILNEAGGAVPLAMGMRIGAALWRFWLERRHLQEGVSILERLLGLHDPQDRSPTRARLLNGLGTLLHNRGENVRARACLEEALAIWEERGDTSGRAAVLNNLGWVACEQSDLATARPLCQEGLAVNRTLGLARGTAVALNNLGWIAQYEGRFSEAEEYHRRSLAHRRQEGDLRGAGFALSNIAWAQLYQGNPEEAWRSITEAREALEQAGDRTIHIWNQYITCLILIETGDVDACLRQAAAVAGESEVSANLSIIALTKVVWARALIASGRPEEAGPLLEQAERLWATIQTPWGRARSALVAFDLHRAMAQPALAGRAIHKALDEGRQAGDRQAQLQALERALTLPSFMETAVCAPLGAEITWLRERLGIPRMPVDAWLTVYRASAGRELAESPDDALGRCLREVVERLEVSS
ncbi:MAG: protein kinase [Rhodothermales bacterium]|nr:protein kinase [Rhodothermales bacterium]